MITNAARCTREIKSRIAMAKAVLTRKRTFSPANWTQIQGGTSKMVRLQYSLYGADAWTLRKVSRSEIPGKFSNLVQERNGKDQLDRSCEK
jgi:hypothetical protein